MHPYVAAMIVNEIASDRAHAARHARSTRRRERRQTIRRAMAGR